MKQSEARIVLTVQQAELLRTPPKATSCATAWQAICSTWPRDVVAQRNAHLAREIVQRAISHRNGRTPLSRLLCTPLVLDAADLGLEAAGLPSLLAERHAVQAEVEALVGMVPLKHFLHELRAKVVCPQPTSKAAIHRAASLSVISHPPGTLSPHPYAYPFLNPPRTQLHQMHNFLPAESP